MNKPPTDGIRVAADELRTFATAIFKKVPIPDEHAELIAELLVDTDLRGVASHGVIQIERYVQSFRSGEYNAFAEPKVVRDAPATAALSGEGGIGMVVATQAMSLAIDKARQSGVGVATSTYHGHVGSVGKYVRMAMRQDMAGVSFSGRNAAPKYKHEHTIAGSIQGSPAMAFGVPSGDGQPYFLLDMATHLHHDLADFAQMQDVLIKYLGVAHVGNIFSGTLAGQMLPQFDRQNIKYTGANQSGFFLAIDIERFVPVDAFKQDMNDLMTNVRQMQPLPGLSEAWLPGGPNWQWEKQYAREGVPVSGEAVEKLERLANEFELSVPWQAAAPGDE